MYTNQEQDGGLNCCLCLNNKLNALSQRSTHDVHIALLSPLQFIEEGMMVFVWPLGVFYLVSFVASNRDFPPPPTPLGLSKTGLSVYGPVPGLAPSPFYSFR